ncbi:hypothetical protein FHX52_0835 [Humibacillus xanthopallidus]|uniref:Uncharacterized protein n=1 Tax=Humibacillus xanthopallidus TaxID=412689 RepID=A0A543PUI9_9MICO|nr:hypothetical protein FHX52_0835 [Humibacillus xanthopallidus]
MDTTARAAWSAIADADDLGLRLREDTVTEGVLLRLARRVPDLILHRFNQMSEKSSGGDWEWFVGSQRAGWIAFRIQAKRMDGFQYLQLDHEGLLPGEKQYDTLIRDSAAGTVPTFPFHVFFNGWSGGWPSSIAWNACPNGRVFTLCKHHEETDMGCSLAPSAAVRILHRSGGAKRLRVETYLPHSVPWSWLFGPPLGSGGTRRTGPSSLVTLLAWHERMAQMLAGGAPRGVSMGEGSLPQELVRWWITQLQQGSPKPEREPAHDLPDYAAWALHTELIRRRVRERAEPETADGWKAYFSDEVYRQSDNQLPTFASPSGLDGLLFTPLP